MVRVIWQKNARKKLTTALAYSYNVFGRATMNRFIEELEAIESRLCNHPESFTAISLLKDKKRHYRGCIVMKNFKMVYYYVASSQTVRVVDFWDMRMDPDKLIKGIKQEI